MRFFRYRKPSVNTLLGITQMKRNFSRKTGLGTVKLLLSPARQRQYIKQRMGCYNPAITPFRQGCRGKFPTPLGCLLRMLSLV